MRCIITAYQGNNRRKRQSRVLFARYKTRLGGLVRLRPLGSCVNGGAHPLPHTRDPVALNRGIGRPTPSFFVFFCLLCSFFFFGNQGVASTCWVIDLSAPSSSRTLEHRPPKNTPSLLLATPTRSMPWQKNIGTRLRKRSSEGSFRFLPPPPPENGEFYAATRRNFAQTGSSINPLPATSAS